MIIFVSNSLITRLVTSHEINLPQLCHNTTTMLPLRSTLSHTNKDCQHKQYTTVDHSLNLSKAEERIQQSCGRQSKSQARGQNRKLLVVKCETFYIDTRNNDHSMSPKLNQCLRAMKNLFGLYPLILMPFPVLFKWFSFGWQRGF